MKHYLILVLALTLPILSFAQTKPIQRIYLKNGVTINGTVQHMADGTYEVKSATGDTFYFLPSEVERITGLSEESATDKKGSAKKGKNKVAGPVIRHRNTLCFSEDMTELKQGDFYSLDSWNKYLEIQSKGKTGRILLYSGIGGIVLGQAGELIGLAAGSEIVPYIGLAVFAAGLGVGISGLCMTISSNKKMSKLAQEFNPNPGYALNFGVQQYGIGFSLSF